VEKNNLLIYLVSDSIGETVEQVAKAAISQFEFDNYEIRRFPFINEKRQIAEMLEEAKQQGIQEAREAIRDFLQVRFNRVPKRVVAKVTAIDDMAELRELRRKALRVESLKEFEQFLLELKDSGK